ncbi:MAG TPA: type II toxin-antitoxin system VapC family toxin [Thermoleophilaceae bacterium]|nr:type II toxin-antitoxin system VapC family toxin [Thermoleophilaceae bacterium]
MARPRAHRGGLRRASGRSGRVAWHEALTLLLDTHVVLWWMAGDAARLSDAAARAIAADDARIVVSAVTVWEVAIKRGLGKLEAPDDLLAQLERARVELLPITARHADLVPALPEHHRDPFDRLLVAQATRERLSIVSADESLRRYGVDVVW